MLIISLILSALLLLGSNWIVFRARKRVAKTVGFSLAFVLAPFFLMCILPAVAVQGLLFSLGVIFTRNSARGPFFFLKFSCAATVVAYAIAGSAAWRESREFARLRALHPYESMVERVPEPRPSSREGSLSTPASRRLVRLETDIIEDESAGWYRTAQLKMLHEESVGMFINSPGFGITRMIRPHESGLTSKYLHELPTLPQPGPRVTSAWSPGEFERPPENDEAFLGWMFEDSVVDFVFARGFGFVKDRRHVAGFFPHQFRFVPAPTGRLKVQDDGKSKYTKSPVPTRPWKLRTLDLVSLLLHDQPAVYVSDHLPRMNELRAVPTRPLDQFEAMGLNVVRQGEDLFISRDGEGLRMLGALYSMKQCVTCHGGSRGELLGAFSYRLQPDKL
jgi:hypothetical protein